MRKKYVILIILSIILAVVFLNTNTYAADLDEIDNYIVTVDPRMNDGSLDITYEITWKVLDSTTEGPLTWVKIGTPNEGFDNATALTNNIKSIKKYSGSYVRIDFKKAYKAGEKFTFKYSIHQSYMYKISWGKCIYKFTPAWFTDIKVNSMTIKWNSDSIKSSNTKSTEDNYLIWNKRYMSKGSKLTAEVKYKKDAFTALNTYKQKNNAPKTYSYNNSWISIYVVMVIIIIIISSIGRFGGGGYYGHRGFYGGYGPRYYGGGCVRSSCACASSSCASSCACACAGSGRAGCSKKDFYGTNLTSIKIKKVLKKEEHV